MMKLSATNLFRGVALALISIVAAGCMAAQSDHPYTPGVNEAIPVPPGARIIASGHYPVGAFMVPHEVGAIYVYDEDARRVAQMTTATPGSQVTDLNQLSKNSFDPTHSYRVYFNPEPAVPMSTQPAAGQ